MNKDVYTSMLTALLFVSTKSPNGPYVYQQGNDHSYGKTPLMEEYVAVKKNKRRLVLMCDGQ